MSEGNSTPRFLPDTSCLVPALCPWHEQYSAASAELERRQNAGEQLVLAAHCLAECFSVLTRFPPPHRLAPAATRDMLAGSFLRGGVEIKSLDADGYRQLVTSAPEANIAGGLIYDAVILVCALEAKVDVLLTFNERHFRALTTEGIQIVVPQGGA